MNEPVSLVDGEYIANSPPTNDPALALQIDMAPLFPAQEIRHHVGGCGFVQTQQDVVVSIENRYIGRHGYPVSDDRQRRERFNVSHGRFDCKRKSGNAARCGRRN